MDEQTGLENRSPSRDRGFESHPLLHNVTRRTPEHGAIISVHCRLCGWDSNGGSEGGAPLHGVTGATRRREGAWPPSGSTEVILRATSNSHPLRHRGSRVVVVVGAASNAARPPCFCLCTRAIPWRPPLSVIPDPIGDPGPCFCFQL